MKRLFFLALLLALGVAIAALLYWNRSVTDRRTKTGLSLLQKALTNRHKWEMTGRVRWILSVGENKWSQGVAQVSLKGSDLFVRSAGAEVWCSAQGCRVRSEEGALVSEPLWIYQIKNYPDRLSLIAANYRLQVAGKRRFSGKNCVVIYASPIKKVAYPRWLAIDPVFGLILRQEVFGHDGTLLQATEWESAQPAPRPAVRTHKFLEPDSRWKEAASLLPSGFVPEKFGMSRCRCCPCGTTAHSLLATDGLCDLTLLQVQPGESGCAHCQRPPEPTGVVQIGSLSIAWQRNHFTWVAVGEVPPAVALQVVKKAAALEPDFSLTEDEPNALTVPQTFPPTESR
ncbi:MAG: hypothetical protein NZ959_07410 [Armatimonadetes bacterium]|nr:hypothetical protein [Armatimonadota bacterium]MDW8122234.1 sigma-E factor regulatory protein RseB domain-containing protein [Armatimonadota bacterium]